MLKAKDYFGAVPVPDSSAVALSSRHVDALTVFVAHSSQVRTNVPAGERFTQLIVDASGPGMVAVTCMHTSGSGKHKRWVEFMLRVEVRDGKTFVDLDRPWAPAFGRNGFVSSHECAGGGEIAAVLDTGTVYTSYRHGIDERPKTRFVPDPNLIASYLAGDEGVNSLSLHNAAKEHAEEASVRQELSKITELCNTLGQYLREIAVSCGLIPAATFLGMKSEIIAKVACNRRDRENLQQTLLQRRQELESLESTVQQALRTIGREQDAVDRNLEQLIGKLFAAYVEDTGKLQTRLAALEGALAQVAWAFGRNWLQRRPLSLPGTVRNLLAVAREQGLLPKEEAE